MMREHPQNQPKAINLLEYALRKEGVYSEYYGIRLLGDTGILVPDTIYLEEKKDSFWKVYYFGRKGEERTACFSYYRDAVLFFFSRLAKTKSPWFYIDEWEKDTGQEFLLVQ